MGFYKQNSLQSKFDQASRISKSVFVSNFPEGCTSKDLWKVCNDYGTVVDVFIPNKKSKAGKRFTFVKFIKLVFPTCKDMLAAPSNSTGFRQPKAQDHVGSYVNVVNGSSIAAVPGPYISSASTLVLDDSCVFERDLSKYAMVKVKDVNSIPNLRTLLMDEGFFDFILKYLGGMWVMFEFDKVDTKVNMMQHIGVKSWFHVIQDAVHDFVSDERIVWVDIEGVPLNVWSRETFMRIGKVLLVRAKELFTWNTTFLAHKEMVYASEDESVHSPKKYQPILRLVRRCPVMIVRVMLKKSLRPFLVITLLLPITIVMRWEVYQEINRESVDPNVVKEGGFVLGVLEEMIRVGQAMGYTMDGCVKDFEHIIGTQCKTHMKNTVKFKIFTSIKS
nr:UvrD-like helicase, ATP-binding domain, P-loop containing nucleoside triphosphate hydrolase [Tanacetum cinerariifolium]